MRNRLGDFHANRTSITPSREIAFSALASSVRVTTFRGDPGGMFYSTLRTEMSVVHHAVTPQSRRNTIAFDWPSGLRYSDTTLILHTPEHPTINKQAKGNARRPLSLYR